MALPKEYTHWAIARKALETFNNCKSTSELPNIVQQSYSLYLLGSVIYDTPFYYLGRHSVEFEKVNHRLHAPDCQDPAIPLKDLLSYIILQPGRKKLLPFLLGAVTHIYADAVFHPLVFYHTGNCLSEEKPVKQKAIIEHRDFEGFLDLHYLRQNEECRELSIAKLSGNINIPAETFKSMLGVLYFNDDKYMKKQIKNTFNIHKYSQILFKKRLFYLLLKMPNKTLERFFGINYRPYLALFYKKLSEKQSDFFSGKISYQHPVTGIDESFFLSELESHALNAIIRAFILIEDIYNDKSRVEDIDSLRIPSPETGLHGISFRKMENFLKN